MKTKASNNIFLVNLLVFISMILIIELILSSFYPYNFGTIGHKHSENALKYGWGWRPFEQRSILHPDSKEIARSKINVDLSDADQARCQAFSEIQANYDPETIKLNMDDYITKTDSEANSCPSA